MSHLSSVSPEIKETGHQIYPCVALNRRHLQASADLVSWRDADTYPLGYTIAVDLCTWYVYLQ